MEDKFELITKKLEKNICDSEFVVAGISGGADSMCLLNLLMDLQDKCNFKLVVAHVHHNVRKESDDELLFVRNYCIKNNLIFETIKLDKEIPGNFESEARIKRYEFFERLLKKYNAKYLFTAHHGDDLMETILMRIVRGSTLKGYSGFKEVSINDNYNTIKPLITLTKSEIVDYDKSHNIPWVNDKTNFDDSHTRNRYRKYILPKLKEENPNVNMKFLKFSENMNECNDYVDRQIAHILPDIYVNNVLNISEYLKLDVFIQKQLLLFILNDTYKNDIYLLNDKHITLLIKMISSATANSRINLPLNNIAVKSYNKFYIDNSDTFFPYNFEFKGIMELPNGKTIAEVDDNDMTTNYICRLSTDEIKLPLIIRSREDGDYIYVKNMNGQKKIKDIFIDSKISIHNRNNWPIVTDSDNNVVWLPGLKKSKYDKQKNEKYDIILRYQ